MRGHATRKFALAALLSLFLLNDAPAMAFPYAFPVYDEDGTYVGCEIGDTDHLELSAVYNYGFIKCIVISIGATLRDLGGLSVSPGEDDKKDSDRPSTTLFGVEPHLVERARAVLKNYQIESINVEVTFAELEVYDKLTVLHSEKAINVIRSANIEGAQSCKLTASTGNESRPIIKIPDIGKNRNILKQARIPYVILKKNDLAGQILATGSLSTIRSVLEKERIKVKETP